MRNFEERKAEVFRRSEKRIKERKARRNHILMACIPLVFCITLLSAFLRPGVTSDEAAPARPDVNGMGCCEQASWSCPYARITVSGNGFSHAYTEAEDLLLISDHLYACTTRASEPSGASAEEIMDGENIKDNTEVYGSVTDSANAAYTVTLVTHEGLKTEYQLSGTTLKNVTANESYSLSQAQVDELLRLLGILP